MHKHTFEEDTASVMLWRTVQCHRLSVKPLLRWCSAPSSPARRETNTIKIKFRQPSLMYQFHSNASDNMFCMCPSFTGVLTDQTKMQGWDNIFQIFFSENNSPIQVQLQLFFNQHKLMHRMVKRFISSHSVIDVTGSLSAMPCLKMM